MAIYHIGYTISKIDNCPDAIISIVNRIRIDFRKMLEALGAIYTNDTLFYFKIEQDIQSTFERIQKSFDNIVQIHTEDITPKSYKFIKFCNLSLDICEVNLNQLPLLLQNGEALILEF